LSAIRAFSLRLNALPSAKPIPRVESLRVWTTSPWKTRSPTFRSTAMPLRVTVADPLTVSTRPIGCCAAGAAA
jgi:hypothetical protein